MEELTKKDLIIAFGSNLGNRENNIQTAISEIDKRIGKVQMVSKFFKSVPIGFESSNQFLNGCLTAKTTLEAIEVLNVLKEIERYLGRKAKKTDKYEDRPIDLDIIFFENETLLHPELSIPHPRFRKRDFVLVPLLDLKDFTDPISFLNTSQFLVKN